MKRAYLRVVMSHGGQEGFEAILQRLPLSPQDHHVTALASEVAGWSEQFLERPKAKGRATAKSNQGQGQGADIGLALMSAAARPKSAPAPMLPPPAPVRPSSSDRQTAIPAPVATSPAPVAVSPAPVAVSPAPVAVSPAPVAGSPVVVRPMAPPQPHMQPIASVDNRVADGHLANPLPVAVVSEPPQPPPPAPAPLRVVDLLERARAKAVAGIRSEEAPGQESNEIICSICQYPIDPANWRENLSLPCGHVYHESCHREMIEQSGGRLPPDECPIGRCNRRRHGGGLNGQHEPLPGVEPRQDVEHVPPPVQDVEPLPPADLHGEPPLPPAADPAEEVAAEPAPEPLEPAQEQDEFQREIDEMMG